MSIFGNLDAQSIPSNPFWVEKGEYAAVVTKAEFKTNRDGDRQLTIEYTIDDAESAFYDSKVTQFFTLVDPDMTQEQFNLLPAEEQKKIRRTLSALKRTLSGNEGNESQKGLGVPVDDLNKPDWDPAVLVNTPVTVAVNNFGSNNEGVAVRWVNLREE